MPTVGVCLSGCGVFDGSEIHEAVLTLLALDQAGAQFVCCAPDIDQADVIDHRGQSPLPGKVRNVLIESARIARGEIKNVAELHAGDLDALIFPGGFGAAKNLCDFAAEGSDCTITPEVDRLIGEMMEAGKPMGAICISPVVIARAAGKRGKRPVLTIGNDAGTAAAIEKMGARHQDCPVTDHVVDRDLKIVSTPAYMLGRGPAEVYAGIQKLVNDVLALI